MFGSRMKAIGFTALIEGIMMTADAGWLSAVALVYLVAINAVANGCRLALRDAASKAASSRATTTGRAYRATSVRRVERPAPPALAVVR